MNWLIKTAIIDPRQKINEIPTHDYNKVHTMSLHFATNKYNQWNHFNKKQMSPYA